MLSFGFWKEAKQTKETESEALTAKRRHSGPGKRAPSVAPPQRPGSEQLGARGAQGRRLGVLGPGSSRARSPARGTLLPPHLGPPEPGAPGGRDAVGEQAPHSPASPRRAPRPGPAARPSEARCWARGGSPRRVSEPRTLGGTAGPRGRRRPIPSGVAQMKGLVP